MSEIVRVGFLPLVDAALPILARELGFAADEGLELVLVRDLSWATVRDRLLYRHTDAAHLVAPLAIATTLGLDRPVVELSVPFVLGLNGNAITLSTSLARQVRGDPHLTDIVQAGARLREIARDRAGGGQPLRLGVVHRFSSHNYMLRYWLSASGIAPGEVEIVTVAPPFVADALAEGEVDGICVGEPWNSVAVERGAGEIVAVTSQIWQRGVEKVLALRSDWLAENADTSDRLVRALYRAGAAFVDPERQNEIVEILARPDYVGGEPALIRRAITDRIVLAAGEPPVHIPDFMFQHREAANFPWVSQAAWLYSQMLLAGHVRPDPSDYPRAQAVFRPDIYRRALRPLGVPLPGASAKLEGGIEGPLGVGTTQGRLILGADRFFDGRRFDPDRLDDYLTGRP